MKKFPKYGLLAIGMVGIATAAYAAEYKLNAGGNQGNTFYTVYTNGLSNYGSVNVTGQNSRGGTLNWDNKNNTSANYVSGLGFGYDVPRPKTVKYSMNGWSIKRSGKGAFGVYGWACNNANVNGKKPDNVEFYIVDAWINGDKEYIPYDSWREKKNSQQVVVSTSHGDYRIWQSNAYTRDGACGKGLKFHQVWAVRTAKRSVGKTEVPVDFAKISGVMDDYGYFTNTLKYYVVGLDTSGNTAGKITIQSVNRTN